MANKPFKVVSGRKVFLTNDEIEARKIEEAISVQKIKHRFVRLMNENQIKLLKDCDWTQLPDSGLSDEDKVKWDLYRQELKTVHVNHPTGRGAEYPKKPDIKSRF